MLQKCQATTEIDYVGRTKDVFITEIGRSYPTGVRQQTGSAWSSTRGGDQRGKPAVHAYCIKV